MRLVATNYLQPGDILARPVINSRGTVLLNAGVELSASYIKHLQQKGFHVVFIEDKRLEDIEVYQTLRAETRELAYKTLLSVNPYIADNNLRDLPVDRLQQTISQIIEDLLCSKDILNNLVEIQGFDQDTFSHSINTTIIALALGMANKYSDAKLLILGMGVIMHDVGKLKIPQRILQSSERLTPEEFEIIKQHSSLGFEILRQNRDMNLLGSHIAFQHHEKWDGSGYPQGLKRNEIHEFARIAAVADVYEALTSWRVYRRPMEPYEAYEYVVSQAGTHFDPEIVTLFMENTIIYANGSGVKLSNGEHGYVIRQNSGFPARPVVRVFDTEQPDKAIEYNLLEHQSIMITKVENR